MVNNDFLINKRVFHIDKECYIIYVGSGPQDYKPFLRIGNSQKLTKPIISNIFNIIITNAYTGNPSLEPFNLNWDSITDNRYVGDKKLVQKFIKFLDNYNTESENINQFTTIETTGKRAIVYFYDDGNARLFYDKKLLFDLKNREKSDFHFIERTNLIKEDLLNNPIHYPYNIFSKPGFFIINKNIFVYDQKGIISFGLPENYFFNLSHYGIDPDLISTVITENITAAIIELFKRKRYKKENVNILTHNTKEVKDAVELFKSDGEDSIKAEVLNLNKTNSVDILDFNISRDSNDISNYLISSNRLPFPLRIQYSAEEKQGEIITNKTPTKNITINPVSQIAEFNTVSKRKLKIIEGIPFNLIKDSITENQMIETYFTAILPLFESFLNQEESTLVKQLSRLVSDYRNPTQIKNCTKNIKRWLKKIKLYPDSKVIFLLINAKEIIKNFIDRGEYTLNLNGDLLMLLKMIDITLGSIDKTDINSPLTNIPLIGDIFLNDNGSTVLYKFSKDSFSIEDLKLSKDIKDGTIKSLTEKNDLYNEDFNDLLALIKKLKDLSVVKKGEIKKPLKLKEEEPEEHIKEVPIKKEKISPGRVIRREKTIQKRTLIFCGLAAVVIALVFIFLRLFSPELGHFKSRKREIIPKSEEISMKKETFKEEVKTEKISEAEKESLESYLSLGWIKITILDVYNLTNKIAITNGYHRLDSVNQLGKDPDWIYPGNVLTLPDDRKYTVAKGDTIWYLAKRFIKRNLEREWKIYTDILKEIDNNDNLINNKKREILSKLEFLKKNKYSENFIKEINKTIEKISNM